MISVHLLVTVLLVISMIGIVCSEPQEYRHRSRRAGFRIGCNCECGVSNRHMRVVGGNYTYIHEFPWVAGLKIGGEFMCGASLITKRHILTAAHCVNGYDKRDISIVLGDHDRNAQDRGSKIVEKNLRSMRPHEAFDTSSYNNDIAILELKEPVNYNTYIQPACLPSPDVHDYSGQFAVVTGWGRTAENQDTSSILKKAVLPVWSKQECYKKSGYAESKLSENMFCAGYPEGKTDACQGDSGGPLHIHNKKGNMAIIGLVSWGSGCARPNFPGIYTKVSNYIDWIEETLGHECLCTL